MNFQFILQHPLELRAPKGRGFAKQSAAKWGAARTRKTPQASFWPGLQNCITRFVPAAGTNRYAFCNTLCAFAAMHVF